MKIKIVFLFFITSFFVQGQQNVKICAENQLKINNLISKGKFEEAKNIYSQVIKNCNSINEKFFSNSEEIFNYYLKKAKSETEKIDAIKKLITVFDLYDKKFPENKNGNDIKKAIFLYDNNLGTKQEIFLILDKNFIKNNFINPKLYYVYFELYINESKSNNSKITTNDLISKFIEIDSRNATAQSEINKKVNELKEKKNSEDFSIVDQNDLNNFNNDLLSFKTVQNATKRLAEPFLTCASLENYSENLFETNKNNDSWLKFVTSQLFTKNCLSSKMFEKTAIQSNNINSNSKSNFYLGYLYSLKNQIAESEKHFNESANLENNSLEKANIYYTIATTIFGINNKSKAKEYLDKSIAANPSFAKPFMFLTQLYESNIDECTKTPFERKAIYWLIASTIEKAGIAEAYLKESTKKQADFYLQKAPTKQEIQNSGLEGKTITFDCFVNQTIDVPKIQ